MGQMMALALPCSSSILLFPAFFTEPIYHSKLSWKMIRTASRIRRLNMAKWLSVSRIDLDIGELPLQSIDFQHYWQRRFSPRKMICCIFSHLCLELLTQFNEIQLCDSKPYKSECRSAWKNTGWCFLHSRAYCCWWCVCPGVDLWIYEWNIDRIQHRSQQRRKHDLWKDPLQIE